MTWLALTSAIACGIAAGKIAASFLAVFTEPLFTTLYRHVVHFQRVTAGRSND